MEKYKEEEVVLQSCYDKLNKKLESIATLNRQLTQKNIELSTINASISMYNRQVTQLTKEINEHKEDTTNVDIEKTKLRELAEDAMSKLTVKDELVERKNLQDIAGLLLKDTGIKTAIIREYLPVMNKLINKYLNVMDSYIHFELDESFNEIIKSRFRDEFTYASFSEGEKQRIDLAILFTWRQIAKMKNSVNTNLLIFDEIMDSSLDVNGTESFMSLLNQFGEDTNIFVISHKGDILFDKFHSVIKIEKKNDFSTIV
jgi:DNA repair exonuclease SbcCD ATPase subunit